MSIISWDVTEADEHLHDRWLQGFCIQVPDKEIRKQLEQIIKQQYQEKVKCYNEVVTEVANKI